MASFLGAYLLINITDLTPLYKYTIGSRQFIITPVKLIISILLIAFAIIELLPFLKKLNFKKKHLPFGGFLSGFFDGLSGQSRCIKKCLFNTCLIDQRSVYWICSCNICFCGFYKIIYLCHTFFKFRIVR